MGLFERLIGIAGTFFQIGGPNAPGINSSSGTLGTRNSTNTAYANHRGADPVIADDFVTKRYGDANYGTGLFYLQPQTVPAGTFTVPTGKNMPIVGDVTMIGDIVLQGTAAVYTVA